MQNNIKNEFIPYEIALKLKELGFDEPCFGLYHNDKTFYPTQCKSHEQFHGQVCSAPLFQQAFRWFREKHNLDSFVKHLYKSTIKVGYYFGIDQYKGIEFQMGLDDCYKTYEETELACLKKLIEIVKSQNNAK